MITIVRRVLGLAKYRQQDPVQKLPILPRFAATLLLVSQASQGPVKLSQLWLR
jgi:hypothetical protein